MVNNGDLATLIECVVLVSRMILRVIIPISILKPGFGYHRDLLISKGTSKHYVVF